MLEVALASEDHNHVALVDCGDNFFVTHRTAGAIISTR
jgi:hypothetical protein